VEKFLWFLPIRTSYCKDFCTVLVNAEFHQETLMSGSHALGSRGLMRNSPFATDVTAAAKSLAEELTSQTGIDLGD